MAKHRQAFVLTICKMMGGNGALEKIRTPDPQIRSLVLYPAELRARGIGLREFLDIRQPPLMRI